MAVFQDGCIPIWRLPLYIPHASQQQQSLTIMFSSAKHGDLFKQQQKPKPYSRPEDRMKQPATPLKVDYEVFDKTRDILRSVYPMNRSASKQIIVSLDPNFSFQPSISIAKTGKSGVKLSAQAFRNLCSNKDYITDYFTNHHNGEKVVNIGPENVVSFDKQYGKKVLVLTTDVGTNERRTVSIQEPTWEYTKNLMPLLNHLVDQLCSYSKDVQQLYEDLLRHCRDYFTYHKENLTEMQQLEKFLQGVTLPELGFATDADCYLDVERAFAEMKLFCTYDIAASL